MTHAARGSKIEVKCQSCGSPFMARKADVKRGWGKFCSKSCKAKKQEAETGQFRNFKRKQDDSTNPSDYSNWYNN